MSNDGLIIENMDLYHIVLAAVTYYFQLIKNNKKDNKKKVKLNK